MKTVLIIFSAIGLLTLNSCKKTDSKAILENSNQVEVLMPLSVILSL
jgi:hypothetical protein